MADMFHAETRDHPTADCQNNPNIVRPARNTKTPTRLTGVFVCGIV
jgi:hypothetical protein